LNFYPEPFSVLKPPRKKMTKKSTIPRKSLFDSLPGQPDKNLYCSLDDLSNEASVETFFVNRLLQDLSYKDRQIQTKKSISELTISLGGAKKAKYKPDFVLTFHKKPRWVLDAKSTQEQIEDWVPQCSGYCLALNQSFKEENPVGYFVLTNGLTTNVYHWDNKEPILELSFSDFAIGNPKYEQLRGLLGVASLAKPVGGGESQTFIFERPSPQLMKTLFASCHRAIWKSEGSSPTAAFMEFTKLMFIKLWCDRQLRKDPNTKALLEKGTKVKLPKNAVTFSGSTAKTVE
jgi:type I restriction enzyme M protein